MNVLETNETNKFGEFKIKRICKALVILLLICNATSVLSQTKKTFISNEKEINIEDFNAKVTAMIDDIGISGLSLAIIENNTVVFNSFYGNDKASNKKKLNNNTVFEAASLTKMYLVYIVHRLVDQGKIDLDKPMYEYFPHTGLQHDSRYKLITPRMILSHSSGIENWKKYNNKDVLEIVSNPGEKFVYSGEGFQYLAKVVEQILNEPYEDSVKKMIIKPLKLDNTYLMFKKRKLNIFRNELPWNYVFGYDVFGKKVNKWKNKKAIPASGLHTTAEDYARFLTYFFQDGNLSNERIKDIVTPIIKIGNGINPNAMGAGFFMILNEEDSIASFSGNNKGFKAELFYSVPNKRGFVFFTNSDHGKLIIKKLNKLSANFDLDFLFEKSFFKQYPNQALSLQNLYVKDGNITTVEKELEKLKTTENLKESTLNELSELFKDKEPEFSMKILNNNIQLFPESPNSYGLLALMYLKNENYKQAHDYFLKAKELNFGLWNVDGNIKSCKEKMTN